MIDMKKKKFILPRILAVASLVGIIVLTLYMSPFVPYAAMSVDLSLNKKPIYITHFSKLCDFAEKAVKLSENESTVYSAVSLFSPNGVCFEKDRSYYPDDFFEKCLYYNQLALDYMEKNGTDIISVGPYNYYTDYQYGENYSHYSWHAMIKKNIKSNVAYSLFVLGRVDEAKAYMEKLIEEYMEDSGANYYYPRPLGISQFLTETYALSNDESYKAWILEKEHEITAYLKNLSVSAFYCLSAEDYEKENFFVNRTFDEWVEIYNQE